MATTKPPGETLRDWPTLMIVAALASCSSSKLKDSALPPVSTMQNVLASAEGVVPSRTIKPNSEPIITSGTAATPTNFMAYSPCAP